MKICVLLFDHGYKKRFTDKCKPLEKLKNRNKMSITFTRYKFFYLQSLLYRQHGLTG